VQWCVHSDRRKYAQFCREYGVGKRPTFHVEFGLQQSPQSTPK
jgi:hypothetical protein